MEPSTTKEGNIYSYLCGYLTTTSSRGNTYIYFMYVCDFNSILKTAMKNIIYKEMIRSFNELTDDFKICGINPGFHFMDNEASTTVNMAITTMNIKYQLVLPSNHRSNNSDIPI